MPAAQSRPGSPMCPVLDRNRSWHGDALCGSRKRGALGHDVKQVPPAYSKPFRQGHKNDFRDAHAIAEAVQRPSIRCVPVKTDDQLDLQALHRGAISPGRATNGCDQSDPRLSLGAWHCGTSGASLPPPTTSGHLAKRSDVLSPRMISPMEDLSGDWRRLDERIEHITKEIEVLAGTDVNCGQLMTVPGIGPIVASATVAARAPPASPCGSCRFCVENACRPIGRWLWQQTETASSLSSSRTAREITFSLTEQYFALGTMLLGSLLAIDRPRAIFPRN